MAVLSLAHGPPLSLATSLVRGSSTDWKIGAVELGVSFDIENLPGASVANKVCFLTELSSRERLCVCGEGEGGGGRSKR